MAAHEWRWWVGTAAVGLIILAGRSACQGAIGTTRVSITGTYTATDAAPDLLTTTDTANSTYIMTVTSGTASPDCPTDQGMVRMASITSGTGSAEATWCGRSTAWGCTYLLNGNYTPSGTGSNGGGWQQTPGPWSSGFQSQNTPRLALEINGPGTADDVLTWGGTGTATVTLLTSGTDTNSYCVTVSDMSNPQFVTISCPTQSLSTTSPSFSATLAGAMSGTTTLTATCPSISVSPTRTVTIGQIIIGPVLRNPAPNGTTCLPYSVSPTNTANVSVQFDPLFMGPPPATVNFAVAGTGGNNGSASISPSSLTGGGTLTVTGITQTNSGYSGQLFIQATDVNNNVLATGPGFSVCAHPSAVTFSGTAQVPAQRYPNTYGFVTAGTVQSDDANPGHLDCVRVIEEVSPPIATNWPSSLPYYCPLAHPRPADVPLRDLVADPGATIQALLDGNCYAFHQNQVFAFCCRRCGMTALAPVAAPHSGFQHARTLTVTNQGIDVTYGVGKTGFAVNGANAVFGYTSSAGTATGCSASMSFP